MRQEVDDTDSAESRRGWKQMSRDCRRDVNKMRKWFSVMQLIMADKNDSAFFFGIPFAKQCKIIHQLRYSGIISVRHGLRWMPVSDVDLTIGTSSNALMSINVHLYAFQRIHRRPICPCHVIWTADISELKECEECVHMCRLQYRRKPHGTCFLCRRSWRSSAVMKTV